MLPISLVGMVGLIVFIWVFWRNELQTSEETLKELNELDTSSLITDPKLLRTSLIVLGVTIIGFFLHGALHLEAATVAMTGAAALMVVTRPDPHEILAEVEWTTLLFFVGLFIVVGGIEHVGLIEIIAEGPARHHGHGLGFDRPIDPVAGGCRVGIGRQHPIYGSYDPACGRSRKRDSGSTAVVGAGHGR